jgi:hypothetical protein
MKGLLTWCASADEVQRVRAALLPETIVVAPPERTHLSRLEATCADVAGDATSMR